MNIAKILRTPILKSHCVKSVSIRNYSGPHFLAFGLNTGRYGVSLPIQPECGKRGREYLRIRHFLFRQHLWWLLLPLAKWNGEECFKAFWRSKIHNQNWKCRSSHQTYSVKKGAPVPIISNTSNTILTKIWTYEYKSNKSKVFYKLIEIV